MRLVRRADGVVEVDTAGRLPGRGAYVCPKEKCWESGLKRDKLEHVLKAKLAPAALNSLRANLYLAAVSSEKASVLK